MSACSPNPRRAAGEVVHLDGELLQVVDARVQLGYQHEEVGSLVVTASLWENRSRREFIQSQNKNMSQEVIISNSPTLGPAAQWSPQPWDSLGRPGGEDVKIC